MADETELRSRTRALTGVVLATALVYPLLVCAVQVALAQFFTDDVPAALGWGAAGAGLCVAVVAVDRWSTGRRVVSPWLLAGLVPPVLFELWLAWPLLTG
ncbi:hypothetical protein SAMN03159343_1787 [Klenkia marina]|uniref:Uncharacterized protein n=1 Tax=Klenkia marina TaxID=1960309 RepID=A0A1G4XYX4_9ACTN|nr:hypothetical protein [Klenkia marina]SCX46356.1 hypothetical protein SAMN03159343_1787 [Klenkia marina]